MSTVLRQALDRADRAWRDGLLVEAHAQYSEALRQEPASWHAAFQLAWIDSAFGPIDPDRVRTLADGAVSRDAATLVELLRDRATPEWADRPDGGLQDWDLAALRASPHAADPRWWEARARGVAEALPNVAHACWEEAECLDPGRYYKRPHAMLDAARESEWHMDALLSNADARTSPR